MPTLQPPVTPYTVAAVSLLFCRPSTAVDQPPTLVREPPTAIVGSLFPRHISGGLSTRRADMKLDPSAYWHRAGGRGTLWTLSCRKKRLALFRETCFLRGTQVLLGTHRTTTASSSGCATTDVLAKGTPAPTHLNNLHLDTWHVGAWTLKKPLVTSVFLNAFVIREVPGGNKP